METSPGEKMMMQFVYCCVSKIFCMTLGEYCLFDFSAFSRSSHSHTLLLCSILLESVRFVVLKTKTITIFLRYGKSKGKWGIKDKSRNIDGEQWHGVYETCHKTVNIFVDCP